MGLALSTVAALICAATSGSGCATTPPATRGTCDVFEAEIDQIWGTTERRTARDQLEAFAGESQGDNVSRLITKVDDLTRDWVHVRRGACRDANERGTMPPEIHERVQLCLQGTWIQQQTLIAELGRVDQVTYARIDRAMLDISEQTATCENQAVLAYYKLPAETGDAEAAQTADRHTAEARTLTALGRKDEAKKKISKATIAAAKANDDRRQIDVGVAACHLNVLVRDFDKAAEAARPALSAAQRLGYAIGEADALTCLGTAELRSGQYDEARRDLEAALERRESFFGADHPRTADAANRLGELETVLANYRQAHELFMRALDIWTKTFGADDPVTSRAYHNLGYAHIGLEDIEGAAAWYQQAIAAETDSLGEDHPVTALSEAKYAAVLLIQERPDDAYELLNHAVEVQERILGPGHPDVAVSYQGIGAVWASRKGWDTALEWYTKALTLRKLAFGDRDLATAETLDAMATAYYKLKKYDDALDHATQAMAIREALLGTENIITGSSYFNLGLIHEKRKKPKEALKWYEKSLAIDEAIRGPGHDLTKQTRQTVDRLRGR